MWPISANIRPKLRDCDSRFRSGAATGSDFGASPAWFRAPLNTSSIANGGGDCPGPERAGPAGPQIPGLAMESGAGVMASHQLSFLCLLCLMPLASRVLNPGSSVLGCCAPGGEDCRSAASGVPSDAGLGARSWFMLFSVARHDALRPSRHSMTVSHASALCLLSPPPSHLVWGFWHPDSGHRAILGGWSRTSKQRLSGGHGQPDRMRGRTCGRSHMMQGPVYLLSIAGLRMSDIHASRALFPYSSTWCRAQSDILRAMWLK